MVVISKKARREKEIVLHSGFEPRSVKTHAVEAVTVPLMTQKNTQAKHYLPRMGN